MMPKLLAAILWNRSYQGCFIHLERIEENQLVIYDGIISATGYYPARGSELELHCNWFSGWEKESGFSPLSESSIVTLSNNVQTIDGTLGKVEFDKQHPDRIEFVVPEYGTFTIFWR